MAASASIERTFEMPQAAEGPLVTPTKPIFSVLSCAAAGPDDGQALGFRTYPFTVRGERLELLGHPGFVGCAVGFVPGRDIAVAMATNRLVTTGTPAPTETLWHVVLEAAAAELTRAGRG